MDFNPFNPLLIFNPIQYKKMGVDLENKKSR